MHLIVSQQEAEALHHLYRVDSAILGQRGIPSTSNQLTGALLSNWPLGLQFLSLGGNAMNGTLPAELGSLTQLQEIGLTGNAFSGELPSQWGAPGAFESLWYMQCENMQLTGTLPSSWGSPNAFQQLEVLLIPGNGLTGDLPDTWASEGAFPRLITLQLSNCSLDGTIPPSWGSHNAYPAMQALDLDNNPLHGFLPAFNNAALGALTLDDCSLNFGLDAFWTSSAPLLIATLANNSISGHLVDMPASLNQLAFLDLGGNSLRGTVPLSWLQDGNMLSHISYLDVGKVWPNSVNLNSWRQQLCLKKDLYDIDVTGQQLAVLPELRQHVTEEGDGLIKAGWSQSIRDYSIFALQQGFESQDGTPNNQLISVAAICANHNANQLLLIVWLVFGGCCLLFHGLSRLFALKHDLADTGVCVTMAVVTMSLTVGPFLIPLVLLLDTCVFIRQVSLCIKQVVRWPGFYWMRPGYLLANRFTGCLHDVGYFGFKWVDLENYESMHNLIAAVLQSLPTVVLNSIIFSLGNKPTHGIFLSSGLFVTAIVASCLAMLKCLVVVLWQAYRGKVHPMQHVATLIVGTTLAGSKISSTGHNRVVELLIQQYHASGSAPLGAPEQP